MEQKVINARVTRRESDRAYVLGGREDAYSAPTEAPPAAHQTGHRRAREKAGESRKARPSPGLAVYGARGVEAAVSAMDRFLSEGIWVLVLAALFGAFLYYILCFELVKGVLFAWPKTAQWLLTACIETGLSRRGFIITLMAGTLIWLLVRELKRFRACGQVYAKSYCLVALLVSTGLFLTEYLLAGDLHWVQAADAFLYGLQVTALPALLLFYLQLRGAGEKGFFRPLAEAVCAATPGHSLLYKLMGGVLILLAIVICLSCLREGESGKNLLEYGGGTLAMGASALYVAHCGEE